MMMVVRRMMVLRMMMRLMMMRLMKLRSPVLALSTERATMKKRYVISRMGTHSVR